MSREIRYLVRIFIGCSGQNYAHRGRPSGFLTLEVGGVYVSVGAGILGSS